MTFATRIPITAALELDRDDVECTIIMSTPCLTVDNLTPNLDAVEDSHRLNAQLRSM